MHHKLINILLGTGPGYVRKLDLMGIFYMCAPINAPTHVNVWALYTFVCILYTYFIDALIRLATGMS